MTQRDTASSPFPSDDDLYAALGDLPGYLDITPGDLGTLYRLARRHALDRLRHDRKARDVMTRDVLAAPHGDPVGAVAEAMAARGVSGVPVVDEGGLVVGVLSEKDFFRRLSPRGGATAMAFVAAALGQPGLPVGDAGEARAADWMTTPAVTVGEETSVGEIADLLRTRGVNRVPVVDAGGRLVGLVSRGDLVAPAFGELP